MKVAKLYSFNDIRIEDIPIPEVGPKDALIKTKACGICSGDVMRWYIEKKAPLVLGHEPAGEIVDVGKEVSSFKRGDRVFTHHHAPCFQCRFCKRGDYVQCETWRKTRIVPGGISEYILIPEINLRNDTLVLPENVSYEDGTLIEPAACVVKGLKRAGVIIDRGSSLLTPHPSLSYRDTVLVIGLGVMGILNILVARKYGAGRIIGADMVPFRIKRAKEFGVDDVIDVSKDSLPDALKKLTDGEMAQLVIVGPNSAEAMAQGISCAEPGGTVLFFTPAKPGEKLTIDPNEIYFKDINLITSYSCGPDDTKEALNFIHKGIVTAKKLVTHRFTIDETEKAYRLTAEAKESLKCLIVF